MFQIRISGWKVTVMIYIDLFLLLLLRVFCSLLITFQNDINYFIEVLRIYSLNAAIKILEAI
jgi:hypothetical protein